MTVFTLGLILLFIYLTCAVALAQFKGDTSIANFTWGGGVMLVALYTFFAVSKFLPRQIIITGLITLWASRLILYVYYRYTGTDPRFTSWKWQGIKALFINSFWVYGQILMIGIMSSPVVVINSMQIPGITLTDIFGLSLWVFGFIYEALSDYQLFKFRKNSTNMGRVLQTGLWRYSRHPNYFGEIVMWWAAYIIALSVPFGWATIISPVTISIFLIFITGIPLLEKAMENNTEYQEYKKRTSALIPWFPKK